MALNVNPDPRNVTEEKAGTFSRALARETISLNRTHVSQDPMATINTRDLMGFQSFCK